MPLRTRSLSVPRVRSGSPVRAGNPEASAGTSAAASAAASTASKSCLVTLLGTGNKFEKRTDDKKVRIESLCAVHIATSGSTERATQKSLVEGSDVSARLFDGADTMGRLVYDIIADATIYIFDQISTHGITNIQINGHSRGAVESIFVANIINQIKERLNSDTPITSIEDLFSDCNPKVKHKLIGKFKECYPDLKDSKFSEGDRTDIIKLRDLFNQISINIFAIDPVPGDDFIDTIPTDVIA